MILTIGDSFTYGEELERRSLAWPELLAERYMTEVTNLGEPGASNDMIFTHAIERTTYEKYDVVIIQWTDPARIDLDIDGTVIGCNPASRTVKDKDWLDKYYRNYYNDKWAWRKMFTKIIALQQHLRSRRQDFIMTSLVQPIIGHDITFYSVKGIIDPDTFVEPLVEICEGYPKGPGGHPLEQGHRAIADRMEKHIDENTNMRITWRR